MFGGDGGIEDTVAQTAGIQTDFSRLRTVTEKFVSNPMPVIDATTVREYAEIFSDSINEDSEISKWFANNGISIADAIPEYVTKGELAEGVPNSASFQAAVKRFNQVFSKALGANLKVHRVLYGNNDILAAQVNAISNGDYSFMRNNPGLQISQMVV